MPEACRANSSRRGGPKTPWHNPQLEIYDTTLRDGAQQEGISLTVTDKLHIARLLDELGVAFVEGGWPGANPKDSEFFKRAGRNWTCPQLPSPLSARHADLEHRWWVTRSCTICWKPRPRWFASSARAWDYHVAEALRAELQEGIAMVAESVAYLVRHGRRVFFDAEHFFDGYASNPDFSLAVLRSAYEAGAERLVLCDTNGGALPARISETLRDAQEALPGSGSGRALPQRRGMRGRFVVGSGRSRCATSAGMHKRLRGAHRQRRPLHPPARPGAQDASPGAGSGSPGEPLAHRPPHRGDRQHQPRPPPTLHRHVGLHPQGRSAHLCPGQATGRLRASGSDVGGNRTRMVVSELSGKATILSKARDLGSS